MNKNKLDEMMIQEGLAYLNHASIGPLPKKSLAILNQYNTMQANIGEPKIDYDVIEILWQSIREKTAKLLNEDKEGVTITKNTAQGLHIVGDGLFKKYKARDNIVMPNIEFVTNSHVWQQIARRYNLELRLVQSIDGAIHISEWEKMIDDNTILVALSFVQFSNGFRSDLKAVAEIAHNHGAFISVDAIQGLGVVPLDVKRDDIDFVSSAGYKWLLAPLGTGIFYAKPEIIEEMDSILVGWFSTPNYKNLSHQQFIPFSDGRKFQQSMIDPTFNALDASLETILRWDVKKSNSYITKLLDYLLDEIESMDNFSIGSSLNPENRSTILKIDTKLEAKSIVENLGKNNITVAYREGGIRISPHAYNTKSDIDQLLEIFQSY